MAKLDRLSRSVVDAGRLLEEARKRGFNIVALDLGLDLSTPTGELVANVLAAVAQWERRMIGLRTSEALQVKIAGGWTSPSWKARVPRAVRRRIVEMAAAGMSQRAIADRAQRGRCAGGRGTLAPRHRDPRAAAGGRVRGTSRTPRTCGAVCGPVAPG